MDRELIDWRGRQPIPLRPGAHPSGRAACLREMVHYLAEGYIRDEVPACASGVLCSACPPLADSCGWPSDEERERVLLPYAEKLLDTRRNEATEIARAVALLDEARLICCDLLDKAKVASAHSVELRVFPIDHFRVTELIEVVETARLFMEELALNCSGEGDADGLHLLGPLSSLSSAVLSFGMAVPDLHHVANASAATVAAVAYCGVQGLDIATLSRRLLDRGLAVTVT